jgi:hypothetical protein
MVCIFHRITPPSGAKWLHLSGLGHQGGRQAVLILGRRLTILFPCGLGR